MYSLELSDSEASKIKQIVDSHNETLIAKRSKRVYKDCKTVVYEPLFTLSLSEDYCNVEYLPAQTVGGVPIDSKAKSAPVKSKTYNDAAPRRGRPCKVALPTAEELKEITDTVEVSNPTIESPVIIEGPIIPSVVEPARKLRGRPRKV